MKNRNMFYQNTQESISNPGYYIPPSGYNVNTQYQSYGPNIIPNQNYYDQNNYDERITRLEKQVKILDNRLQKIESSAIDEVNDNFYTI